jgi:signal transduction histidine kinase
LGTLGVAALGVAATWRPAKRLANRMVFGKRATPYEVLADFSDRLGEAYSNDDVLPRMAKILQEGTGAEQVLVWLRFGHEIRVAACSPLGPLDPVVPVPLAGDELPAFEPGVRSFAVRHRGELLGAFTLRMPVAEPLRGTGEKLVTDLAAQAGLVLRNVRLAEELRRTIDELRASRQRIVTAQDERARKLERDIHDGAQQQLVALSVKLGLAEQLAGRDPERARAMLAGLKGEATDALENLRDLARGIYPPLLAEEGLEAALAAQAQKSALPTTIRASGLHRYPQEIEAAVYFCALEALQNAAKYAQATSIELRLEHRDEHLGFEVADDGHGFDPARARGSGLTNMRDRVEALGGVLEVISTSGSGATIRGRIPVEASG